jgi:hypothetical protein
VELISWFEGCILVCSRAPLGKIYLCQFVVAY